MKKKKPKNCALRYDLGAPGFAADNKSSEAGARIVANRRPRQELILLEGYARTYSPFREREEPGVSDWQASEMRGLETADISARRNALMKIGLVVLLDCERRENPDSKVGCGVYGLTEEGITLLEKLGLAGLLEFAHKELKKAGRKG